MSLTQRNLVNRRLRLADGELVTKYVFPFWNREWKVALHLVDRLGRGPAILHPPLHEDRDHHLVSPAKMSDLRGLELMDPAGFKELYHYDPWWVFRGIAGVSDELKHAISPTNISKPFHHDGRHWKVHDIEIAPDGGTLLAIIAKDDVFRRRDFTAAELDLGSTWPRK